jgi:flagellar biosynthesis/type III secretory pathway protein FliH
MSESIVQTSPELPVLTTGSILRPATSRALVEAEIVLAKAREIEAKSREAAEREAEIQRKSGFEKGLHEGLLEARVHNLETVAATSKAMANIHQQICEVVVSCLRTLLRDMPSAQRIEQAATLALESVNLQQTVVLCVNPADLQAAVPVSQKLSALMSGGARVECRGREDVQPGDCLLETPMGIIRCSLEDQLAAIQKALLAAQD